MSIQSGLLLPPVPAAALGRLFHMPHPKCPAITDKFFTVCGSNASGMPKVRQLTLSKQGTNDVRLYACAPFTAKLKWVKNKGGNELEM
jgi:hypothetical protein